MKNHLLRGIYFILIGSILGTLLTGCSNSQMKKYGFDKDNPISIKIWNYYNGPQLTAFDNIVNKFNETIGKEQGIIVESFSQGSVTQLEEAIRNSAQKKIGSESMPDVFASYADAAYEIDSMGLIADLDQYLTSEEKSEYIDSFLEEGRIGLEEKLCIFPIAKSAEILIINKTDWEPFAAATGTTTKELETWETLSKVAEKYYLWTDNQTPEPDDGKAFFGRDSMANYMIIGSQQLGHEIFHVEKDKVTLDLNEKVLRKLWDNYYVPYINGYYFSYGRFRSDDLKTGDILCFVGSTSGSLFFPSEVTVNDVYTYEIESIPLPVPRFQDGKDCLVQQGAGFVVTKSDIAHEYASTLFLKYFTDIENNIEFSVSSGYLPVKKEAFQLDPILNSLKKSDIKGNKKLLEDTLTVAINQAKSAELYTTKAFFNGSTTRAILSETLDTKAEEDREKIEALLLEGMSREEAVKRFNTEENFFSWYQQLKTDLENAIK